MSTILEHKEPWERRNGEPAAAFHAFATYRSLGPARTIAVAAAELGRTSIYFQRLSAKWKWVERAQAWDDNRDKFVRDSEISEAIAAGKRHAAVAMKAIALSEASLDELSANPEKLSAREAATLLDIGVKIERQALGMNTPERATDDTSGVKSLMEQVLGNPELVAIMDTVGAMLMRGSQQVIVDVPHHSGAVRDNEPASGNPRALRDPGESSRVPDGWSVVEGSTSPVGIDGARRPGNGPDTPSSDLDATETWEE